MHTAIQAATTWGDFQFGLVSLVVAVVAAILLDWLILHIIEH